MHARDVLDRLRQVEGDLRSSGVASLYLFGSVARGDQSAASDVDLAFDVDRAANDRFSLLDQARLQLQLEKVLGGRVDLVERVVLKGRLRAAIEPDLMRVF